MEEEHEEIYSQATALSREANITIEEACEFLWQLYGYAVYDEMLDCANK